MGNRLAIITTHPIQYYAPLFKLLAERGNVKVKVFYTWGEDVLKNKYDPGFGKVVTWDIPLLDGYEYEFVENIAKQKGSHHYSGIDNPDIIQRISNWEPDAILVFGWNFKSHLKVLRYFKKKVPVFFRGDSTLLNEKPGFALRKIFRKAVLTWVYKHIDIAFYVGTNNKAYYKKFGLKENQLIYAPHVIDNERFIFDADKYKKQAAEWRQKLNIDRNSIVYLFAGKLESNKEPLLLLNAFSKANLNKTHLIFVGNGEIEHKLKQLASQSNNIHFIDFQNQKNMPLVYYMSDVFVLPSKSETWGLAINEAMACGKAIITSDKCGGAIDLIANDENGFIFDAEDEESLTSKLIALYDIDKITKMGLNSFNRIKQFNFVNVAEKVENALLKG